MDPRTLRISPHFVLSDFLGNSSVYSKGLVNTFDMRSPDAGLKIENVTALCYEALEPLLATYGPLSISYGYISPEVSEELVKYQDPSKPSHHRFDLGAAADVKVHRYIAGEFPTVEDLYLPESAVGSPISLAYAVDTMGLPYSRLITYSESPFICIAVSAKEVVHNQPRKAFYENRFQGRPRAKPEYIQYSTAAARTRGFRALQEQGLEHDWRGAGYPTYHGGGHRQLQHVQVSKYTVVSDWLFDEAAIRKGFRNSPSLNKGAVQDALAAAGIVYDAMLDACGFPRMSIVSGYTSHATRAFDPENDWRGGTIRFSVNPPDYTFGTDGTTRSSNDMQFIVDMLDSAEIPGASFEIENDFIVATVEVEEVLSWQSES